MRTKIKKAWSLTPTPNATQTLSKITNKIPSSIINKLNAEELSKLIWLLYINYENGHTAGFYEAIGTESTL